MDKYWEFIRKIIDNVSITCPVEMTQLKVKNFAQIKSTQLLRFKNIFLTDKINFVLARIWLSVYQVILASGIGGGLTWPVNTHKKF